MSGSPTPDSSVPLVIGTKLRVPLLRPEQVLRPRLLEMLDEGLDGRVTLISAPAGYGKTILLSQWLRSRRACDAFAWVSLDEQDDDPIRLWRHIVEALGRGAAGEEFGTAVLAALSVTGTSVVDTVLPMLVNELGEVSQVVLLVLDDYQFATGDGCQESMGFFVDHLPENVHLVLATRADPPLHLGRLRARGELNEIRTEQLAFSEREVALLLKERPGLHVDPEDLCVLLDRTEGWPAGIYLAALSLEGKADVSGAIESFGGSNHYILDLLGEEVLAGLPEEEREFMLKTSVLGEMTGPLCDEVVGGEGSGAILDGLARSNLFVVALDDHGGWYRYHHLFCDLLLYELKGSRPDLLPVLHGRASAWFEREGLFEDAIRHALSAADYERAGALIAHHWFRFAVTGQLASLERWLGALPEHLRSRDAPLVLVQAWMCAIYGHRAESEHLLQLAESLPYEGRLPDGSAAIESETTIIRAIFGYGGVKSMVAAASRAAELESGQDGPWRMALVKMALGQSSYLSGDVSTARKSLDEAIAVITADQPLWRIGALYLLSVVATDEGRLDEAESRASEARSLVERFMPHGSSETSAVSIALGRVLAKLGRLEEAQTELEKGLSARRSQDVNPWPTLLGLLALARVRAARGDRGEARALLREAWDVVDAYPDAGIFPALLEQQERELSKRRQREAALTEVLTNRELDVLRLFEGDDSYRQIGQSLYVSVNTVKTHVRSIFRKLGVTSRHEALERAREKALI
jgi:LuxR family transcriptional regulator, maltose regulon positive regulatory protein